MGNKKVKKVYCKLCGWEGDSDYLIDDAEEPKCPICDGTKIEPITED